MTSCGCVRWLCGHRVGKGKGALKDHVAQSSRPARPLRAALAVVAPDDAPARHDAVARVPRARGAAARRAARRPRAPRRVRDAGARAAPAGDDHARALRHRRRRGCEQAPAPRARHALRHRREGAGGDRRRRRRRRAAARAGDGAERGLARAALAWLRPRTRLFLAHTRVHILSTFH
jgi:hypothetical protein